MEISRKVLREKVRENYLSTLIQFFTEKEEDVLRVASNEIAFPVIDEQGNEDFLVITLKVPTGSRDGDPYDGYSMAEAYQMKISEKAEKAKKSAELKKKKIERDKKYREEKEKMKGARS